MGCQHEDQNPNFILNHTYTHTQEWNIDLNMKGYTEMQIEKPTYQDHKWDIVSK